MEILDEAVQAILVRPYVRRMLPDPDGGYTVTVQEFPGCVAEGDTAEQALENFDAAAASWVAACLEEGYAIAVPIEASFYSGKIALRIPSGLHEDIAALATLDGCSVNHLLAVAISEYVGRRHGLPPARGAMKQARANGSRADTDLAAK